MHFFDDLKGKKVLVTGASTGIAAAAAKAFGLALEVNGGYYMP